LVVERSTAKNPAERYQTIAEMIDDLETALEVEAARAGSTTGEATSVLDAVPPPQRKLSGRARWSWAAIAALVLVAGGALLAVQLISSGIGGGGANKGKGREHLALGATDYDPQGDGEEVGGKVELAADGDPTGTAWETEHYDSETFEGTKTGPDPGVGVYVTASSPAIPTKMIVRSPTPGWDAQVYAAPRARPRTSPAGATRWAKSSEAGDPEEIDLSVAQPSTYFLLWFTKASEARDQPSRYQIEISDIELLD
jgi:serine/threonine-protein kinase